MSKFFHESSDGLERWIYLTGLEDDDVDSLESLLDGTSMTYIMYEYKPSSDIYIQINDLDNGYWNYYPDYGMVKIEFSEDYGIWYLA